MAEALRANICSKSAILLQRGPVEPRFQVEGVAPTNHSSSQKTRLNDLSCGIQIWADLFTVLSQCTRLTEFSSLDRVCMHRALKTNNKSSLNSCRLSTNVICLTFYLSAAFDYG